MLSRNIGKHTIRNFSHHYTVPLSVQLQQPNIKTCSNCKYQDEKYNFIISNVDEMKIIIMKSTALITLSYVTNLATFGYVFFKSVF